MIKKVLFLFFLMCCISTAQATDYYCSPSGSGNGLAVETPGNPSTLDSSLSAGDTLYFLSGTYSGESIEISASGTSENPITLTAYSTMPVISGSSKTGTGISITGDYVIIDGLNITNYNRGISASGADYLTVQNCELVNNYDGLYIDDCDFSTIQNNIIYGNLLLEDTQGFESGLGAWAVKVLNGNDSNTVENAANIVTTKAYSGTHSMYFTPYGAADGDYPEVWMQKQYNVSYPCDYQVCIESYYQSDLLPITGSGEFSNLEGKISATDITAINVYPYQIMGYFESAWSRGVWWQPFSSSDNTFYVSEGVYSSRGYTGYIDDIIVSVIGKDTNNGITIINSQQPLIQNNSVKYITNDGVYLNGCSSPNLIGNEIEYVLRDGLNVSSSCSYSVMDDSNFFKTGRYGAYIGHNNFTADNNTMGYTAYGAINSKDNSTVTNNTMFSGHSYAGESLATISTEINSNVSNNIISYGVTGIRTEADGIITNNTVNNTTSNAVNIEYRQYNITIANNTISSYDAVGDATGIRLKMLYGSLIKDNYIYNEETGISLISYNSMNCEKNTIENNTIIRGTKGISCEDIVDDTIINNTLSDQLGYSVYLEGPISTWTSFRNGVSNAGLTDEYVLPSPFGIVAGILNKGYTTPGLSILWTTSVTTPIKSTPATYDNVLYVVTNGTLYAINNNDGSQLWNYSTGNIYPSTISGIGNVLIHSSPAISGSNIYFGSGTTLYAVNTSGGLVWSYPTEGQVISSPQISGGNVYVGSTDGKLYAITAATGALNWTYDLGDAIVSTPCAISSLNGRIVITAKGYNGSIAQVYNNGTAAWTGTLPKNGGWSSPGFYGGYLYFPTDVDETGKSSIYAYGYASGSVLWSNTNIQGNITGTPDLNAGGSGVMSFVTDTGAIYALSLTEGTQKDGSNTTYSSYGFIASPVGYYPGHINVNQNGTIYRDFEELQDYVGYQWSGSVPTNVSSSPIHSYGKLFICGENGVIYTLVPASNITISGNNISNAPVGIYSFSTEVNISENTFTNVPKFLNFTHYFSRNCVVENNTVDISNISVDSSSYTIAKTTNIQNISFVDSKSKYGIENNNIRLTTKLNKTGNVTRSIENNNWNQSYLKWNDTGSDFTATYNVSGLQSNTVYTVFRDGSEYTSGNSGSNGILIFSNSEWSEHEFEITATTTPTAAFSASTTSGAYPLKINFTDESTNDPMSWAWDLDGNGIVDKTTQNVSEYKYKTAGNYTVSLTATNAAGNDTETKTAYIHVTKPTGLVYKVYDWFSWIFTFVGVDLIGC